MLTNHDLIKQWQDGEKRQSELWKEILARGLYLQTLGIDPDRRDNAWRNPPSATMQSEREFYNGVRKSPGRFYRHNKQNHVMTREQLAEFE